jgi:hypothetical protein
MAAKKAAPKKAAPAKKKAPIEYPEGASGRSKNAQSKRLDAQVLPSWRNAQPKRGNKAAALRMTEYERKNRNDYYRNEGNEFTSTALQNAKSFQLSQIVAKRLKAASDQKKQGVTKSGGYAKDLWTQPSLRDLRSAKSAKFKAEQAVKKTGSMTRNAGNKKKNAK